MFYLLLFLLVSVFLLPSCVRAAKTEGTTGTRASKPADTADTAGTQQIADNSYISIKAVDLFMDEKGLTAAFEIQNKSMQNCVFTLVNFKINDMTIDRDYYLLDLGIVNHKRTVVMQIGKEILDSNKIRSLEKLDFDFYMPFYSICGYNIYNEHFTYCP